MREDDDAAVPYCASLGDVAKVPPSNTIVLTLGIMYNCSSVVVIDMPICRTVFLALTVNVIVHKILNVLLKLYNECYTCNSKLK